MPQRKGEVSEADAKRLVKAVVALKAAQVERDRAIAAALKAGGSTREVGEIVGMSATQVMNIGHAHGWPTAEQRSERDRHRQELAEWREWIEQGIAQILDRADED